MIGAVTTSLSIYNEDGTINTTGTIKDQDKVSMSDKRIVYKEHKRLSVKFGSNNSGSKGTGRNHYNANSSNTNTITQLYKHKNNLKALKQSNPSDDTKKEEVDDARDEFGGKEIKKEETRKLLTSRLLQSL